MGCPRCWLLSVLDGSYCQCFSFFGALAGMTRASAVEMAALVSLAVECFLCLGVLVGMTRTSTELLSLIDGSFWGPGGDDQDIG